MKELVEVIAKSLVDFPDEVVVTESENEKGTLLELRVAQSDMGKSNRKAGTHCESNPCGCESSGIQRRQKVIVEIMQ
mgnify:CR=1 FL=1